MKALSMFVATSALVAACSKKEETKADPSATAQSATQEAPAVAPERPVATDEAPKSAQRVSVMVTGSGYDPATVEAKAGEAITLVFKRTTEEGCGEKLVFPDRDLEHDLPLNEEVEVVLTPEANEIIAFTCGMGMYKGSIVVAEN